MLSALHELRESGYAPPSCLPRYWEAIDPIAEGIVQSDPYALVAVNMPPEMYDADDAAQVNAEGKAGQLSFFGEDVSGL